MVFEHVCCAFVVVGRTGPVTSFLSFSNSLSFSEIKALVFWMDFSKEAFSSLDPFFNKDSLQKNKVPQKITSNSNALNPLYSDFKINGGVLQN